MSSALNSAASFHLLPQTPRGWWAVRALLAGVALFVSTGLLANVGGLGGSGWLALTVIPAFATTLAGAIAAAVAVIRDHERGVFAFIPIGELAVPH